MNIYIYIHAYRCCLLNINAWLCFLCASCLCAQLYNLVCQYLSNPWLGTSLSFCHFHGIIHAAKESLLLCCFVCCTSSQRYKVYSLILPFTPWWFCFCRLISTVCYTGHCFSANCWFQHLRKLYSENGDPQFDLNKYNYIQWYIILQNWGGTNFFRT